MKKKRKSYFVEFISEWGAKRILIALTVIVFMVAVILFYYSLLTISSKNGIIDKGRISAVQAADRLDRYLSTGSDFIELAAFDTEKMMARKATNEEILRYMEQETTNLKQTILDMTISVYGYIDGVMLNGNGWIPPEGYVAETRPWYTDAINKKGELAVTDPYVDANTGSVIVTLSKLLSDGKSVVGVDIYMDTIQHITEDIIANSETEIECIIDSNGYVISHSDKDQIGKSYTSENMGLYSEITDDIFSKNSKKIQDGYYELKWEGKQYIVYYVSIQNQWVSVSIIDATGKFIQLNLLLVITITLLALIIGFMLFIFSRSAKKDNIAAKLNSRLSSAANIYLAVYDIDVKDDSFGVIHAAEDTASEEVGENYLHAQNMIYELVNCVTDESYRTKVLKFVDFSTLNERISSKDNITIEYLNDNKRWRRGRFIVSERSYDGRISHVLWSIEDIDDEKKIRDTLYNMAETLNKQVASLGDIYVIVCDIDLTDDSYSIVSTNNIESKTIEREFDISAQMYIHKNVEKLANRKFVKNVLEFTNLNTIEKRLNNLNTITVEFLNYKEEWCRGRFIASQWSDDGKLTHVLWTVESINDEKQMRDSLIEMSAKAISANAAKSAFLSNMSHEIRTPINAVLGMNEMVLRECEDENIIAYSESIRNAGNTLLSLINDILDISKIESGKMEILPVDYNLSFMLNDLITMIQSRVDDKGLTLVLDIDKEIPQFLNGDEMRLKQVITNILTNAVKYTNIGMVTFGMSFDKIEDDPDSIMLNVYIKDTGIGIKEEDMNKLFSEFERIDELKNRNIEGTGLGMNITQSLLFMMGSKLQVQSVYELGSRFSFSVNQKVTKWEAIGDYETSYNSSLVSKKKYKERFTAPEAKVLVVDDTPMNLMVFKSLLKQTKVQIDLANSGDEALTAVLENKYDIIFLDHMMPKKDGIQTLKEMKALEDNQNHNTAVVCLTANAIYGARDQYMLAGFDDYLTKPIDPVKLEEMLMRYLPSDKVIYTSSEDEEKYSIDIEEETQIPDFVYDISEIDVEKGLKNFTDKMSYLETLMTHAKMLDSNISEIQELYDSGNIPDATIKIHALKSNSRIVGAFDIGDLAQELENAGNEGDTEKLAEGIGPLLDRCRKLSEQLAPLKEQPEEQDDRDLPPISDEEFSEACELIKEYSMSFNSKGILSALEDLREYKLSDEKKEKLKQVEKATVEFEYESIPDLLA